MSKTASKRKQIIILILYIICIFYITLFSRIPSLTRTVRPIPLWSFIDWLKGNWARGGSIVLNVILFIPLGYLLAGVWKLKRVPLIICLGITIGIELIQYVSYRGYYDIDDIIVNFIGGWIGVLFYEKYNERVKGSPISMIFLVAGIIGCIITTGNSVTYETQFGFDIYSAVVEDGRIILEGECSVYGRDGLKYYIQLKGEKTYSAETMIDGGQFLAIANAPYSFYEVDVVFNGYPPISTGTYLKDGQIVYAIDYPQPEVASTDLNFIINEGILKLYNTDYDVYVYQVDDRLYWLIGKAFDASIIYHLYTDEPDNLPDNRKQYGFDNRGFKIGSDKDFTRKMDCGKYRVFSDIIPRDYHVTAITVGMNKGPDVLWKEMFRANSTD